MKNRVFLGILTLVLILTSCGKKYTTVYSVGCIGFRSSEATQTDWQEIDNYMTSTVNSYNKTISFENKSVAENDAEALNYFNEQFEKVDKEKISSLIKGADYYIYGIRKAQTANSYTVIKAYKFDKDSFEEYKEI